MRHNSISTKDKGSHPLFGDPKDRICMKVLQHFADQITIDADMALLSWINVTKITYSLVINVNDHYDLFTDLELHLL